MKHILIILVLAIFIMGCDNSDRAKMEESQRIERQAILDNLIAGDYVDVMNDGSGDYYKIIEVDGQMLKLEHKGIIYYHTKNEIYTQYVIKSSKEGGKK